MKTKKDFVLKEVCGEYIIISEGEENIDFTKIISMNESSAFLWNSIKDKDFSVETLVDNLTAEYDIDRETATNDAKALVEQWLKAGIIEK